jgi:hypothetical protein
MQLIPSESLNTQAGPREAFQRVGRFCPPLFTKGLQGGAGDRARHLRAVLSYLEQNAVAVPVRKGCGCRAIKDRH